MAALPELMGDKLDTEEHLKIRPEVLRRARKLYNDPAAGTVDAREMNSEELVELFEHPKEAVKFNLNFKQRLDGIRKKYNLL